MAKLHVERIGGLAGYGAPGAHIRSHGEIDTGALSAEDQQALEALFQSRSKAKSPSPDEFSYRISRTTSKGVETIEVPESQAPAAVVRCVKDELV